MVFLEVIDFKKSFDFIEKRKVKISCSLYKMKYKGV